MARLNAAEKKQIVKIKGRLATVRQARALLDQEFGNDSFDLPAGIGDAWNGLHDAESGLEAEIQSIESEAGWRGIPQATRELIQSNID
jgi:hypothetical protein